MTRRAPGRFARSLSHLHSFALLGLQKRTVQLGFAPQMVKTPFSTGRGDLPDVAVYQPPDCRCRGSCYGSLAVTKRSNNGGSKQTLETSMSLQASRQAATL